ncbi:MAG: SET domain-containing protein [Acidobacteriota bacterium]
MPLSNLIDFQIVETDNQKGVGLFTTRKFKIGEAIYRFDYWSKELMPMHVTNHSCDPNSQFNENGMLIAIRDIEKGEEITYNYLLHPTPASPWNFSCQCGSDKCIGWISVNGKC